MSARKLLPVLLITTVGDIDIELWSREAPKACRNFVQLCMEGYYNGTIFHRVVKGFIAQGGDPTGTGSGGESIYGEPFKDEIHSRLRFMRRGLVAMANAGKDDNGSQFFFTFAASPELQGKHTIFGKVTGETLYNMLKLEDALTDSDERPLYPQKVVRTEILSNPFADIVPRTGPEKKEKKEKKGDKKAGVKNFKLLSFGEEAEEDEAETREISASFSGRSKSTHDVLDDPKLSSVPAVDKADLSGDDEEPSRPDNDMLDKVKEKLKRKKGKEETHKVDDMEDEEEYHFGKDEEDRKKQRLAEIKKEIRALKKEYQNDAKQKVKEEESASDTEDKSSAADDNSMIQEYKTNLAKYAEMKKGMKLKGSSREEFTLALLSTFKKKLEVAKEKAEDNPDKEVVEEKKKEVEDDNDEAWLAHELRFEETAPVLAKDASTKNDEWFEITDPRHAINKRRREAAKKSSHKRLK